MKTSTPSGLLRAIDPTYPSNLLALGLATIGGCLALARGLAADKALIDVFLEAIISGVAVFMGWAIARELDPDHPGSAGLAGLFGLIGMQFIEPRHEMLVLIAVMLSLRSIARTTGVPLKRSDYAALAFWWTFGLLLVIPAAKFDFEINWLVILNIFGVMLFNVYAEQYVPDPLVSVGDHTQEPLQRRRIKLANRWAGVFSALFLLPAMGNVILPLVLVSYALCIYALYLRGRS